MAEAGFEHNPGRMVVARAMYTAPSDAQARRDTETPLIWFKQTGQEVGAPPEHQVDLLPQEFEAYRRRFAKEVTFDFNAMYDNVTLFGTPEVLVDRLQILKDWASTSLSSSSTLAGSKIKRCWIPWTFSPKK